MITLIVLSSFAFSLSYCSVLWMGRASSAVGCIQQSNANIAAANYQWVTACRHRDEARANATTPLGRAWP